MPTRSKILFLILLCTPLLHLSAQEIIEPLNRRISVQMDSTTIESLLEKLVTDNELYFSYNPDLLPTGKRNFSVSNVPLKEVLQTLLPDSLFKVSLIGQQLIINKLEPKPIKISGKVVEKDGKSPIPFAAVALEGTYIGTMTNQDGDFDLTIPWPLRNNKIMVSSLGYKQQELSLEELKKTVLIRLQSESIRLREILVKPTDPKNVLQQFRNSIANNYCDEPQLMVTFYRETARQDGTYVGVWEAVMEILKPPYENTESERVRFIKGRKADLNHKPKEVFLKVQGGPLGINSLDVVKHLETFLDPEYEYLYQYHFEQPEIINGRITWIIRFDRLAETDFPCFRGRVWIDADSYALVGAEYSYDKKSLKINGESFIQKEPFGFDTRPENVNYSVRYRLIDNKWQFYTAHSDIVFRVKQRRKFKTEYRNVTDALVTQQYPFPRKARFGPDGLLHEKDIFSEKLGTYDKDFWGNYNVIKPDEELIKAIKEAKQE